ncbi:MAG: c-type cytochrome [Acidobacteriota bacterium]
MVRRANHWWLVPVLVFVAACRSGEEPAATSLSSGPSLEPLRPERVREIFTRSCESCHGPQGYGITGVAPDLRRIASRKSEEWGRYLRTPGRSHPVDSPPPRWLTADEIELMAQYLVTIPTQSSVKERASE